MSHPIGYLLKTFPKLSETFILNEILELERQGLNLHIFSLRKPQDTHHHPAVSQIQAPITYLPSMLPESDPAEEAVLLQSQMALNQREPARYLEVLQFYLERTEDGRLNEFMQGSCLALAMENLGIGHLHVHFANVPTATAEIAQQFSGISYSLTAHAKDIYLTESEALNRRIAGAEFVLTCTDYNRRYLEKISTSGTPIYLSYHGVDLSRFSPSLGTHSHAPSQPSPPLQILSVGRFCEKKGFSYLLEACRRLRDAGLTFHCNLVGYGPLEHKLAAQIKALDLGNVVTIVGKLTQNQVIEQYRQADIFVLPCQVLTDGDRDGIPNVLLEAMAMGVPVISTAISGITELIQSGENGLLVPEKNVDELVAALTLLARDRQMCDRIAQAGRETVHQYFPLAQNVSRVKILLLKALLRQPFISNPPIPSLLSPLPIPTPEAAIQ